jgi:hypothetical protein
MRLLMERHGKSDRAEHAALAGNYFWVCQSLMLAGDPGRALELWRETGSMRLIGGIAHRCGFIVLEALRHRTLNRWLPLVHAIMPRGTLIQPVWTPMEEQFLGADGSYRPAHHPLGARLCGTLCEFSFRQWFLLLLRRPAKPLGQEVPDPGRGGE